MDRQGLAERLGRVRAAIDQAARAAGRDPGDVTLVAVSKLHPAEAVAALAEAGHRDFGESYIQEACAKQEQLAGLGMLKDVQLNWHFIGRLQSNKARFVPGRFCLLHSLDGLKLAQTLHKRLAVACASPLDVLVQVNLGGEVQKCGLSEQGLPELAEAVAGMDLLRLRGLMLMPPVCAPDRARVFFSRLRQVRDKLEQRLGTTLPELSMGMSGDFAEAVAEGATLVRVGTDIFGPRPAGRGRAACE